MILSFYASQQLSNIVVSKTLTQSQGTGLRAIRLGRRWIQHFLQPDAERGIHDFLERFVQLGSALLCRGRDIRIERQRGSHKGIMMPLC